MDCDMRCEESSAWALGERIRGIEAAAWMMDFRGFGCESRERDASRGSRNVEIGLQNCQDGRNGATTLLFTVMRVRQSAQGFFF
jgi:hypothetical protein